MVDVMALLTYADVKDKEKTLQSMTSLTREEFETLAKHFEAAWQAQQSSAGYDPKKGGRKPSLSTTDERLFFILFYLKTYPLQEVLAHLFGLTQSGANHWVHRLSEVLKAALAQADHLPARLPEEMLVRLNDEAEQALAIDGTERRIHRPKDDVTQRRYYSGKKKRIRSKTT